MSAVVALINPKYPRNVGNALRACSNFNAQKLAWTPDRIDHPDDWPIGVRLPREERMRLYRDVYISTEWQSHIIDAFPTYTPVAVEVRENAERLPDFVHPADALYVFGPEDGSIGRAILGKCHRFVVIPSTNCLNLAAAVNVVLYDRMIKVNKYGKPREGWDEYPMPRDTPVFVDAEG